MPWQKKCKANIPSTSNLEHILFLHRPWKNFLSTLKVPLNFSNFHYRHIMRKLAFLCFLHFLAQKMLKSKNKGDLPFVPRKPYSLEGFSFTVWTKCEYFFIQYEMKSHLLSEYLVLSLSEFYLNDISIFSPLHYIKLGGGGNAALFVWLKPLFSDPKLDILC